MTIRPSLDADKPALRALHEQAFGDEEGVLVGRLALALLDDPTAQPLLSLVVEEDGSVLAHVMFTALTLDLQPAPQLRIMAPLAVTKARQRDGLGARLIEKGCRQLQADGVECVMVLGDPAYYGRHGFTSTHALRPSHEITPGALGP
jgi:putative acetyltransferase